MGRRIEKESHEKVIGCQGSVPTKKMLSLPRTILYIANEALKPKGIQQETFLSQIEVVWKYIYQKQMIMRSTNLTIKMKYKILETKLAISR
jgi:hypothetical protein